MSEQRPPASAAGEAVPEGLWTKCPKCDEMLYQREWEEELYVCRHCGHHRRLSASERISITADEDSFREFDENLRTADPLAFPGYEEKLTQGRARSGVSEAIVCGEASISAEPVVLAVMDFNFIGGSMGAVAGEKFARASERAAEKRIPLVTFACSGGARMQEGIVSLLQMAKTAAAAAQLARARVPFIVVLTDPLTAGVFASFASLGDVCLAEQNALVGFTGPRVIEAAFKIKLPPGSHTAEFQLQHGMVDIVAPRRELVGVLGKLLRFLRPAHEGGAA